MWMPPSNLPGKDPSHLLRMASILFIIHGITLALSVLSIAAIYGFLGLGIAGLDTSTHGNPTTHNFTSFGNSTAILAAVAGAIGIAIGAAYFVGAYWMRKQKNWGLLLVLSVFAIPAFPFGTAAGFFGCYVLLDDSNKGLFL